MVKIPYAPVQQVQIARESPAYQQIDTRGLENAFGAQIGQAVSGLGKSLGNAFAEVGAVYEQRQEKAATFDAERRFQEMNGELARNWLEVKRGAPVNGEGLPEKMSTTFQNIADKGFLESLPQQYRERYAARVENLRQDYALKSISEKFQMQDRHSQTTLNERFQEEIKGVSADPNSYDARAAAIGELIRTSTLPEETKEAFAKQAVEGLKIARARREEPEIVAAATGGLEGALRQRESSNNPRVVNQLGYAGSYQFGAPRLTTMGVYRPGANEDLEGWSKSGRHAPGKWSGTFNIPGFPEVRTLDDFLANPAAQRKAYDIHDNLMDQEIDRMGFRKYVGTTHRGVPITVEGLKAGMHLGGAGGVQKFFQGEDSADANGTKVASYIRMGAGVKDAPSRYAGVPQEKLERAMNDGINERARDEATANAARTAQNKAQFDSLMLAIDRGQAGRTEIESGRTQGWLDDAGTLRAENALDALNKKTETLREAQAKMGDGAYGWNPLNPEDKKSINVLSEKAAEFMKPAERMAYDVQTWEKTQIASDNLMRDLGGGMISTDPQRISAAAQIASNMVARNPNAFAGAENRQMIERNAWEYQRLTQGLGFTTKEAVERIAGMNDPDFKVKSAPKESQLAKFKQELTQQDLTGEILQQLNPGFWFAAARGKPTDASQLGVGASQIQAVQNFYKEYITDYYAQHADLDAAKNFAKNKLNQQFGISQGTLMMFPPEKAQGIPAINGTKDWVYRQAAMDITALTGKPVKAENVELVPTDGGSGGTSTRDAFAQGKIVPYEVRFWTEENGYRVYDTLYIPGTRHGRVWAPDAAKFQETVAPDALVDAVNKAMKKSGEANARREAGAPVKLEGPANRALEERTGMSFQSGDRNIPQGSEAGAPAPFDVNLRGWRNN
jgi:hypothetical protein